MPHKSRSDNVLADRLDVLADLAGIERDIAAVDATYGLSLDSLIARQRLHETRARVLQQLHEMIGLRGQVAAPGETIH
jgi:hypothetical protein